MTDLQATVEDLSCQAFALARRKAEDAGADVSAEAEALNVRLDELVPEIQQLQGESVEVVRASWTDARADALWAMSDGNMPTSLRLGAYLRDRR